MKDNQYQFFESYQKNNLEQIRNDLKNQFEAIDQEIFFSSWRKNKGFIPDGFKSRTIITIYGLITFKRRIYKYWDKFRYRYVFLADKKIQIEKYSRVTSHLKFKILEQISSGKRQRDITDMFLHAKLSRVTISKIMSSVDLKEANQISFSDDNYEKVKIPKYLYINMDETFINLRKNNKMKKYRIRLVTFHTGYHKMYSTNKRKVLANKRVFFILIPISKKIAGDEFADEVYHMAQKFYLNVDSSKIIIGGDGASWIRSTSSYFPNSDYVLDKFHAVRYLKNLFRSNQENYFVSKKFFELGNFDKLITFLKTVTFTTDKSKRLKEILTYFRNNKEGILNQSLDWNIGVCAEADISHIVKWLLGYGAKAFNFKTFKNMLLLRCAKVNKLDIISYLKNKYQSVKKEQMQFLQQNLWIKRNRKADFAIKGEWKKSSNKWKTDYN